ncbi:Alpha/Beta hydrolase protein [Mrakia frigida]|uniref:Alpha/Beta hydrolase protein n=1 Tax=Mrakia frigida TaxID=29902 RepID=UPI003FCC0431
MLPPSFSFFALLLIPPIALASLSPSDINPFTTFHPIQKHHHSILHPPSPKLSNSSSIFSASSPLAFQLKTTRKTVLRRRAETGSSGLLLQGGGAWSNLGWDSASTSKEDDDRWDEIEVEAPDLTDKQTVLNLARMANDAYATPGESRWMELDKFNLTLPFGWGEEDAGLRGHVFADSTNSTLVVSFKGTSLDGPVPKGGSTAKLDRINDNKLFSCCCGHLNPTSPNVCPCFVGGRINKEKKICDSSCVEMSLYDEDSYYVAAISLYAQIRLLYPHAQIWLVGHSLGGVISALLGLTFSLPTVSFEAPPDRLAVRRLRLDMPPGRRAMNPVTHIYHTGDVMAVGKCRGVLSLCGRGGYAMESECHEGNLIVYETVEKWGWNVDLTGRSHTIQYAIDNVYSLDWNDGEKEGPEGRGRDWTDVPPSTFEKEDCSDCGDWTFLGQEAGRF